MVSALDALFGPQDIPVTTPPYVPPQTAYNLTAPEHKGLFGMKGNLRNIIGLLGDALSGQKIYQQTRQREKASDAMLNYVNDPLGTISAMTQVDPEMAFNLKKQYDAGELAKSKLEEDRQIKDLRAEQLRAYGYDSLGRIANAVRLSKDPKKMYASVLPQLKATRDRFGLSEVNIPDIYDEEALGFISGTGMKTKDQEADQRQDLNTSSMIEDRKVKQAQGRERLDIGWANNSVAQSRVGATLRGQDLAHSDRIRGQDLAHGDRQDSIKARGGSGAPNSLAGAPPVREANGQRAMFNGVKMITKGGKWVKARQGIDY